MAALSSGRVVTPRVELELSFRHHGVECISHRRGRRRQPREQFERVGGLIDRKLAPGHDPRALRLRRRQQRRQQRRYRPRRPPITRRCSSASGTGVPRFGSMPTGVALTTPAAPRSASSTLSATDNLVLRRQSIRELFGPAPARPRRCVVSETPRPASAKAMALPTPPAPIDGDRRRVRSRRRERADRARKSRGVGVVTDQPAVADNDGVDRAHGGRFGRQFVEQSDHRFLVGKGDVDAGEAKTPDAVEQRAQLGRAGAGDFDQLIVAARAQRRRRPARASRARPNARSGRRSGR